MQRSKTLAISRKNRGTIEVPRFFQLVEARGVEPLLKIAKILVISTLYFLWFSISCENVLFFPHISASRTIIAFAFFPKNTCIFQPIAYTISAGRNTLYTRVNELTFKRHFSVAVHGAAERRLVISQKSKTLSSIPAESVFHYFRWIRITISPARVSTAIRINATTPIMPSRSPDNTPPAFLSDLVHPCQIETPWPAAHRNPAC